MQPIYPFVKKPPRRFHTVTDHLERELLDLEMEGIIMEQVPTEVVHVAGRFPRPEIVTLSGGGTMRNGISFIYVHQLVTRRGRKEDLFVIDEFRSYGSIVAGEEVLIRYDSGHRTHRSYPHCEAPWCEEHDIAPPLIPLDREVELSTFLHLVDEWRAENYWRLPPDPPALESLRLHSQ